MKLSDRASRTITAERGRRIWKKAYLLSLLLSFVCIGISGYVLPSPAPLLAKIASSLAGLASVALAVVSYFIRERWGDELNAIEFEAGMELAKVSGKGKAAAGAKRQAREKTQGD